MTTAPPPANRRDWAGTREVLATHWTELAPSWAALIPARARRLTQTPEDLIGHSMAGASLESRLVGERTRSKTQSKFVERASLLLVPEAIRCGHTNLAKRKAALETWLCTEHAPQPRQHLRGIVVNRDGSVGAVAVRALIKAFCWKDLTRVVERCDAGRLMWPYIEGSFRHFVAYWYREPRPKGPPPPDTRSLTDADYDLAAGEIPINTRLERAQLRSLKQKEVTDFLARWYAEEVTRHVKKRKPAPRPPLASTAPRRLPPGLDRNCADCLQLWAFVLSLLEWDHQRIAKLIGKNPGHSRLLRTMALQRLKADLTRQPTGLDYSKDRGAWGVLLSGWLLWDQFVDLSCAPADLGTLSPHSLEMREGWRHSGHVVRFHPNPSETSGPTAVVFDEECVAGDAATGAILMNQARIAAATGGGVAYAWVEVPPSRPGIEPIALTLSASAPASSVTVHGVTADLPVTVKTPSRGFSVKLVVHTAATVPEPAHVEIVPSSVIGGHRREEVTAVVTLGSLLVAETAASRASGVLAIAPVADAPATIDLRSSHPSIARTVANKWTSDTAVFEIDVDTSLVSATTSVEIVAAGPNRQAGGLLSVRSPVLRSVGFDPRVVFAGSVVTGTVTFANPVSGPTDVQLAADHSGVECRPSFVTVAAGSQSALFALRATDEAKKGVATVIASAHGSQATAKVEVIPNAIRQLTLEPTRVSGGARVTASIRCLRPVGEPVQVRVGATDGLVKVPSTPVTISAGSDSASFEVETTVVGRYWAIEIFAEAFSTKVSSELKVTPNEVAS